MVMAYLGKFYSALTALLFIASFFGLVASYLLAGGGFLVFGFNTYWVLNIKGHVGLVLHSKEFKGDFMLTFWDSWTVSGLFEMFRKESSWHFLGLTYSMIPDTMGNLYAIIIPYWVILVLTGAWPVCIFLRYFWKRSINH